MGQQQLLLLVLGIVIVGLAVVTGIESFEENRAKSEFDRYAQMGVELAAEIIAWYQKPAALGGAGEDASKLAAITIADLGYPLDTSNSHAGKSRTGTTPATLMLGSRAQARRPTAFAATSSRTGRCPTSTSTRFRRREA